MKTTTSALINFIAAVLRYYRATSSFGSHLTTYVNLASGDVCRSLKVDQEKDTDRRNLTRKRLLHRREFFHGPRHKVVRAMLIGLETLIDGFKPREFKPCCGRRLCAEDIRACFLTPPQAGACSNAETALVTMAQYFDQLDARYRNDRLGSLMYDEMRDELISLASIVGYILLETGHLEQARSVYFEILALGGNDEAFEAKVFMNMMTALAWERESYHFALHLGQREQYRLAAHQKRKLNMCEAVVFTTAPRHADLYDEDRVFELLEALQKDQKEHEALGSVESGADQTATLCRRLSLLAVLEALDVVLELDAGGAWEGTHDPIACWDEAWETMTAEEDELLKAQLEVWLRADQARIILILSRRDECKAFYEEIARECPEYNRYEEFLKLPDEDMVRRVYRRATDLNPAGRDPEVGLAFQDFSNLVAQIKRG